MRLNPHGDGPIYETMVRLSKGYGALLHPFVDSKGNFGKVYSRDMAYALPQACHVGLGQVALQGGGVPPALQEDHRVRRLAGEVVVVLEAPVLGADSVLEARGLHRLDESRCLGGFAGVGDVQNDGFHVTGPSSRNIRQIQKLIPLIGDKRWRDAAALERHLAQPHMARLRELKGFYALDTKLERYE